MADAAIEILALVWVRVAACGQQTHGARQDFTLNSIALLKNNAIWFMTF